MMIMMFHIRDNNDQTTIIDVVNVCVFTHVYACLHAQVHKFTW